MTTSARSIDAPAVAEDRRQAGNQDVPVIARAVLERIEANFRQRVIAFIGQEKQLNGCAMTAKEGEIDAVRKCGRPQGKRSAAGSFQGRHGNGRSFSRAQREIESYRDR